MKGTACAGMFVDAMIWCEQAKCQLGDETRLLHLHASVSYVELLEAVHAQFPSAGPVKLKYLDRCGGPAYSTCDRLKQKYRHWCYTGLAGGH